MSKNSYQLSVVLLNYRTPGMILDCLATLVPQTKACSAKVVVVDNCSGDDSIERISSWIDQHSAHDTVELVVSERNGGFSYGNNVGIKACDASLYLLLNSDTLLRDGAIEKLLAVAASHEEVGIFSPRLEWPDGAPQESCFRYHRPLSQLLKSSGTGLIRKLFPAREVALRTTESNSYPEWTSFACVLVRKEVLAQIGLMDEKYFMYFEDAEFCYRAQKGGWKVLNHPSARVVHLRGGSSPVKSNQIARKRQARYYYEARTRYFYTLFGHMGLLSANLLWTLGWFIAGVRSIFQPSFDVPVCDKEWRDIWINFSSPERPYVHPEEY